MFAILHSNRTLYLKALVFPMECF